MTNTSLSQRRSSAVPSGHISRSWSPAVLLGGALLAALSLAPPSAAGAAPSAARTAGASQAPRGAAPRTGTGTQSGGTGGVEDLNARLPLDPAVNYGKLANGFTYYIRKNGRPEKRAELWLVVNAGSVLEDEDQQGLAHFVEHMAFNGTTHFAKDEIGHFIESIGMRFGADLNAATSFDSTVYTLRVPTDRPEVIDKSFQVLEDWAHEVTFPKDQVDRERGVVIEEWRLGRGAEARLTDLQWPALAQGSRYAERIPIGKKQILETATPETLRRFYRDWYRPELMAVVAVGDFDVARIEALVKEHFSGLKDPQSPRPRLDFPVPDHQEPRFAVATDPEARDTSVQVETLRDKHRHETVGDLRRDIVETFYFAMLNERFDALTQKAESPLLRVRAREGGPIRSRDMIDLDAGVPEGGAVRGLEAMLAEVERAKRYGFTASELDRTRREVLRSMEDELKEKDKRPSPFYAAEYRRHFLTGTAATGIEYQVAEMQRLVPGIQLSEANAAARELSPEANRVVLVSAPAKPGLKPPPVEELLAVLKSSATAQLAAYEDNAREGPLVASPPKAGTIVAEKKIEEIGVTEWQLSNGVRVVLKPTDFQNDQIRISGFSLGGTSLVPDAKFTCAEEAAALVRACGVGDFDRVSLGKLLAGKSAAATVTLTELQEGALGAASAKDVETMFQLLYLSFIAPRKDREVFTAELARLRARVENRQAEPAAVFADKMSEVLAQGHPRARPMTPERLKEIDLDTVYDIYRQRFGDASGFTFVLVGNLDLAQIKPLVLTYLGGLPARGRHETWRDVGLQPPAGVVKIKVEKGLEPKSQVRLVFSGDAPYSREGAHDLSSLATILQIRLREVLRQEMGAVYGVAVSATLTDRPHPRFRVSISFGCAPEKVDELVNAVFSELGEARGGKLPEKTVQEVRTAQLREREVNVKENGYWLSELVSAYERGEDPREILHFDELVSRVTPERMQAAARQYLDPGRYVLGVLVPEAPAASSSTRAPAAPGARPQAQ